MQRHLNFVIALLLVGCTSTQAIQPKPFATAVNNDLPQRCQQTAQASTDDWEEAVVQLTELMSFEGICTSNENSNVQFANAYLRLAEYYRDNDEPMLASRAYETVLRYDTTNATALSNLQSSVSTTPSTSASDDSCTQFSNLDELPDYAPTDANTLDLRDDGFYLADDRYPVYGVNYYPRDMPFNRFLQEADDETIQTELALIRDAGFNTLRVFLHYNNLFTCEDDELTVSLGTVANLDALITDASNVGYHLILVLHHDVPLEQLINQSSLYAAQTSLLINRYKDEPAILAWDIIDQADVLALQEDIEPADVTSWFIALIQQIRQNEPTQALTAGWSVDAIPTADWVDFVSFQHFGEYDPLRQKIATLRANTTKPILLTAIGYSTLLVDETTQRNLLFQAFEETAANNLLGWAVYMAFDYPLQFTCTEPDCPGDPLPDNSYGVFNTSYFPKLAVDAIKQATDTE